MVGPEQFQEAGTGIRGGDELPRHVALHVGLPEMVVYRVGKEGAACFGDVDQVSGRQVAEDGGEELGGEGNQA